MGGLNFKVQVAVRDQLSPMAQRAQDLSPAWLSVITSWVDSNTVKFEEGRGAEQSGVFMEGSDVYWKAVTEKYYKQKHGVHASMSLKSHRMLKGDSKRTVYQDWLMKATGNLMDAMTDKGAMIASADINPDSVDFGFPDHIDEPMKILGNWERRQTIFLSHDDMQVTAEIIRDYIGARGRFEGITNEIPDAFTQSEQGYDFGEGG
jgi:hypothetical protein